jgi:hypothetical protein
MLDLADVYVYLMQEMLIKKYIPKTWSFVTGAAEYFKLLNFILLFPYLL